MKNGVPLPHSSRSLGRRHVPVRAVTWTVEPARFAHPEPADAHRSRPSKRRSHATADTGARSLERRRGLHLFRPFGRLTEFATEVGVDVGGNVELGSRKYAYIDGTCEVGQPSGAVTVEVFKGFEYIPFAKRSELGERSSHCGSTSNAGSTAAQGWYSGDTWAKYLTPHAALPGGLRRRGPWRRQFARRPKSRFGVRLASSTADHPNIVAFSGQQPAMQRDGHVVVVNTLNHHDKLGRLALLNCHRADLPAPVRRPRRRRRLDFGRLVRSVPSQRRTRRRPRFFRPFRGPPHGELLADLHCRQDRRSRDECRLSTARRSRFSQTGTPSSTPVFAFLGRRQRQDGHLTPSAAAHLCSAGTRSGVYLQALDEAVRAGRTFVTNGPLLFFTVDDHDPCCSAPKLPTAGRSVECVRVEAKSLKPFDRVEVVANGIWTPEGLAPAGRWLRPPSSWSSRC